MNSGMFAVVFGAISGIFALVLFATLAADWIEDRFGTFASVCFFVLFGALAAGLAAAVLA